MVLTDSGAALCTMPAVGKLGGAAGPTVSILGGVHGDEIEGVLALRGVVSRLTAAGVPPLRGTLRWIAPAHPAAWVAGTRACPADGLNLARVFPGDPAGRPTERLAAYITTELIAGSDLLIDLHSGGREFDMPLLCGFHSAGSLAERSAAAAAAFGAPITWLHPRASAGRSLSAAEDLAIPSIYVEGHGGGQLRRGDLQGYVDGVLRILAQLGMIDDAPAADQTLTVSGDGDTDAGIVARSDGYLVSNREAGALVKAGEVIATIVDDELRRQAEVHAPVDGVIMLMRRRAKVVVGDTLAIVAAHGGEVAASSDSGGAGVTVAAGPSARVRVVDT